MSNVKIQFDYSRGIGVKSSRFEMLVPAGVLKIDDESILMLKYSYMRNGSATVWDLGGVYVGDSIQNKKWVGALRRLKPAPSLPEETQKNWHAMTTGVHPWEGIPYMSGGRSEINALINAKNIEAGKSSVGYALSLNCEGNQPVSTMKNEFAALERGFTTLE